MSSEHPLNDACLVWLDEQGAGEQPECGGKEIHWQDAKEFFTAERVDLSPKTLENYSYTLSNLLDGQNIRLIGRLHILKFLQKYDKAVSYNTNLFAIKSFFAWASVFYGFANPADGLKCKRQSGLPDVRVLDEGEYKAICGLTGNYRDKVVFLCNTGLRAAEFCALRPEHFQDRSIRVFGKGAKPRIVPLNDTAQEIANRYDFKVNYNFFKEHYCNYYNVRYACLSIAKELNLEPFGPHSCRHYFATFLVKRANIADVSKLLGHASIQTTISRYYHPTELELTVGILDVM